jgi:hypothetical protein
MPRDSLARTLRGAAFLRAKNIPLLRDADRLRLALHGRVAAYDALFLLGRVRQLLPRERHLGIAAWA